MHMGNKGKSAVNNKVYMNCNNMNTEFKMDNDQETHEDANHVHKRNNTWNAPVMSFHSGMGGGGNIQSDLDFP